MHLGQSDPCSTEARKQLYTWQMIGGTANTLQDCETLLTKEVDYISLGPFKTSTTKYNLPEVLGLYGYTAITDILKIETPILGIGGITIEDVTAILETGITGLAISEEITPTFDSIKIFNQLLKASSSEEQRYTFK